MNGLYPNWQHIFPLRKFQLPQFDCPKCRFLLHQGKPSVLQATYQTPNVEGFNVLKGMISTYQCTN